MTVGSSSPCRVLLASRWRSKAATSWLSAARGSSLMVLTLPVLGHNVSMVEYEYLVLSFGREVGRNDIRRQLTEHAEYGSWELERTRTWLRRRIIRPRRSMSASVSD